MKTLVQKLLVISLALFITNTALYAEYLENATPPAKTFDWMELQSGEWLKGEFIEIFSGDVVFDSDEMGVLSFDMDDVKLIVTKGHATISIEDQDEPVEGQISFENGEFKITKDNGSAIVVPTSEIASIAGGADTESSYWSANIMLGLDVLSGNTEQVNVSVQAHAQRRSSDTRLLMDYLSNYTKVDNNVTTADSNRASASFDIYQTSHFYWRAGYGEYLRDPFQNIAHRYTFALGVGYDILYTPKTNWSVTTGPGYQSESYKKDVLNRSADANLSDFNTPILYMNMNYDYEVTPDVDFIVNYNMYYQTKEGGTYLHHAIASLETEMINDLIFNVSLIWDKTASPQSFIDDLGVKQTPEEDDYRATVSLGYSY